MTATAKLSKKMQAALDAARRNDLTTPACHNEWDTGADAAFWTGTAFTIGATGERVGRNTVYALADRGLVRTELDRAARIFRVVAR